MSPNRIAVYLTALAALATAVAPAVADLDLSSTAGLVGGLFAIAAVVRKWLEGWQMFEERTAAGVAGEVTETGAPAGDDPRAPIGLV